jgi:AraC-like DNA-binding protein
MSRVEHEAIARINAFRQATTDDNASPLLSRPAHLVRYLIRQAHGHVKLRLRPIATELGIEARTLERVFIAEFGKSMQQYQMEIRLKFAQYLLSMDPPEKIVVVANLLGYNETRGFVRFFQTHLHQTPSSWGRAERARLRSESLAAQERKDT